MTSRPGDTGQPEEPAADQPEPPAGLAGGNEEAAEPPPADFDPAEHPSNPDLVADDER
ncbi:hypothetical protein G3T36_04680 [Diaminobutyricibacter tongyongensis]|uniref:Uncharacterized protein n=1 Tax=Leifsonia tongyongensis TaxID=1268043 RepID=A0A6L9XUT7_9MICO|nr:hypothetical protein [Diaminobutyricibacter tongyongensis]NEN05160.1 hypothetical protein [Diaminobutyricibacter tongyongensis]